MSDVPTAAVEAAVTSQFPPSSELGYEDHQAWSETARQMLAAAIPLLTPGDVPAWQGDRDEAERFWRNKIADEIKAEVCGWPADSDGYCYDTGLWRAAQIAKGNPPNVGSGAGFR